MHGASKSHEAQGGFALSFGSVALYVSGWVAVALSWWGGTRAPGLAEYALLAVSALCAFYLLYLAAIWLFVVGVAAVMDRLVRSTDKPKSQRFPGAWWIVLLWWGVAVPTCAITIWLLLDLRGSEAWWPSGSILAGSVIIAIVYGRTGWQEKRRSTSVPAEEPRGRA